MLDLSTFAFYSAIVLAVGFALYRAALPKPIPGIPYNAESAKRILGKLWGYPFNKMLVTNFASSI